MHLLRAQEQAAKFFSETPCLRRLTSTQLSSEPSLLLRKTPQWCADKLAGTHLFRALPVLDCLLTESRAGPLLMIAQETPDGRTLFKFQHDSSGETSRPTVHLTRPNSEGWVLPNAFPLRGICRICRNQATSVFLSVLFRSIFIRGPILDCVKGPHSCQTG